VRAVGQGGGDSSALVQRGKGLAGPRVPDLDRPVETAAGNVLAVRAEGDRAYSLRVLQGRSVAVALSFKEVPLPAAQQGRTFVQQFLCPADIASGQLPLRQSDALVV